MRAALAAAVLACTLPAWAQETYEGCVPAAEAQPFSLSRPDAAKPVRGVVLGRGSRAVVFSNTAYDAPCAWLPAARELAAQGFQVVLWRYANEGLAQIADLSAIVAELRQRGAQRLVLVGGSRGGCLSMMAASEITPPVSGVAMLSCAAVFNRRQPTPTAAWADRLSVPVLMVTAEHDAIPMLDEARSELARFPVRDKRLLIVPGSAAHGDQLLTAAGAAELAKPAVIEFIHRTTQP